ncbi:MAG: hypothetical protein JNL79_27570 [Myxococcales bacterium]|nr:hypothetical protein [Myxococcales bacterium]
MRTILFGLLCALGACGGTVTPDTESAAETGGETAGETSGKPAPSLCCPISPAPACCMAFGGSDVACRTGSGMVCDNLPEPGDPRWERRIDANGCPYWFAPEEIALGCKVGSPPPPPPDQICTWTDDAGVHTETCARDYGCCAASSTGSRCVPRGVGTPCH